MGNAKCIGRIGALAAALGVGNLRPIATRMTVSIGAAALVVMATVVPVSTASASSSDVPPPDKTALILGGTTVPTPDNAYIETVRNHFIAPTHPGQDIDYVAVTTPEEAWPATGIGRLVWLAVGPPSIWGPGGPAWPAEPWWKLSGLFDLTFDQSVRAGVADLEDAMAEHGNDHLVMSMIARTLWLQLDMLTTDPLCKITTRFSFASANSWMRRECDSGSSRPSRSYPRPRWTR